MNTAENKNITVYSILNFIISIIGLIISYILTKHHINPHDVANIMDTMCSADTTKGCHAVNQSGASMFIIPTALWGAIFYGTISILLGFFFIKRHITIIQVIFLLSLIAAFIDLFLLVYSIMVLNTVCNLCIITYFCTFGILLVTFFMLKYGHSNEPLLSFGIFSWLDQQSIQIKAWFIALIILFPTGNFLYYFYSISNVNAQGISTSIDPDQQLNEAWKTYYKQFNKLEREPKLSTTGAAYKGSNKPVIEIVEFADYLCPACKSMTLRLKSVLEKYSINVKMYFKHYPLDATCNPNVPKERKSSSCQLAYFAHCIKSQSMDKFWTYTYHLYENQGKNIDPNTLLKKLNLNAGKLQQCTKAASTKNAILEDIKNGEAVNVTGTPTIFINHKKIAGGIRFPNDFFLEKLIDEEIKKLAGK